MRKFLAIPVAATLLLLGGCGVTSGTIVDKEEAESEYKQVCRQVSYGGGNKNRPVKTRQECSKVLVTECFEFTLETKDGQRGDVCVTPEEFDLYEEGDYYPKDST